MADETYKKHDKKNKKKDFQDKQGLIETHMIQKVKHKNKIK